MRYVLALLCLAAGLQAQDAAPSGKWVSDIKFFGNDNYARLEMALGGNKLTGKLGNNVLEGTFESGLVEATVAGGAQATIRFRGRLQGDRIIGTATFLQNNQELMWEATREVPLTAAPQTRTFEPIEFQHFFSDAIAPVLRINPGDTVSTWSVDAGGTDPKGVRRASGGNPLTGPFYIEGAVPGDTLAVHFNRIRLNRDSAIGSPLIANAALTPGYVEQRKSVEGYNADWKIDLAAGLASLAKPTETMKNYRLPLAPMLRCVGAAPPGGNQCRSGFLGDYGGNMDYNQLREGTTVYLPVFALGGLLFLGDGHALQGAGELTGNALETSMDIEFRVDLERGISSPGPRMENAEYLMASGIAGSIDEAFRNATTNLVRWLENKYGLNAAEVSSVLGTAVVYDVAEVVDPANHVVAKVPNSVLAGFKPAN